MAFVHGLMRSDKESSLLSRGTLIMKGENLHESFDYQRRQF
jgi:hypothetical protein